jgi:exoribonuclease R
VDDADIANRFRFHKANAERQLEHEAIRSRCRDLAETLNDLLPEGREKSLAMTHLEEVMMWANAAIARQA